MTDNELKDYAADLMVRHAEDVEWLTIFEMSDELLTDGISDEDAQRVSDLIRDAKVTVSW